MKSRAKTVTLFAEKVTFHQRPLYRVHVVIEHPKVVGGCQVRYNVINSHFAGQPVSPD
jgi:hypothetical protein